jgi:hypothetical protein
MPLTNLDTVRDTLAAVHADLKRAPGLELASELIETALMEITLVEQRRLQPACRALDARSFFRRKA